MAYSPSRALPIRIPTRYHSGMTIQIAVRLPDDIVEYVDQQVTSGSAASRAAVVTRALERDRRRHVAEQDAQIYASSRQGDLDELASWAVGQPMEID
jgi:Arc/MetJ-type ribon-helix-helix transcriptional regulator